MGKTNLNFQKRPVLPNPKVEHSSFCTQIQGRKNSLCRLASSWAPEFWTGQRKELIKRSKMFSI